MANSQFHKNLGVALGALSEFAHALHDGETLGEVLVRTAVGGLAGGIGGLAPDILEPANSPHHRGFFHSYSLGTLLTLNLMRNQKEQRSRKLRYAVQRAFQTGYLSHLAADARTPMGLRLI